MNSLSIVIPAYNEENRLPKTLDAVIAYLRNHTLDAEILVVDDGSTDGTARCVREYELKHSQVRLLQNPGNRGKGFSVRHGMLEAKRDWALFTDADLSAPIEEFDKLATAVKKEGAEVAIGSRGLDRSLIGVHQSAAREHAGRVFNAVMQVVTALPFQDTQCGFKLYRSDAARAVFSRQKLDGFGFDVEDLFIASLLGLKVVEVPVRWNNVEGTKVSLTNGLNSFVDLLRIRRNQILGKYRQLNGER